MARLAVMLVGAALVLSGCGGGSSSPADRAAAPATVDRPFRCPDPKADPSDVVDDGTDSLPVGARAAKLCWLDNRFRWIPPGSALTSGLDELTDLVNRQKVYHPDPDTGCGGVGAPAWSMVFRYADGTRTITGDNGGCWDLLVGESQRYGSKHVFQSFVEALLGQHSHEHPGAFSAPPPPCPKRVFRLGAYDPVTDATRARVAALCIFRGRASHRVLLTTRELATLRHDFTTASGRRTDAQEMSSCSAQPPMALVVRGLDAWREPFTVDIECGAYRLLPPGATRYWFVRLLPRTRHLLDGLT